MEVGEGEKGKKDGPTIRPRKNWGFLNFQMIFLPFTNLILQATCSGIVREVVRKLSCSWA